MKTYYVIVKTRDGKRQPAYIINSIDNELEHHLQCYGDAHVCYEEYKTFKQALSRMNEYNQKEI